MQPFDVVHIGLGKCMSTYLQTLWARDPSTRDVSGRQLVNGVNQAIAAHAQRGEQLPAFNLNFEAADAPNRVLTSEGFTFSFLNEAELGRFIPIKHVYVARTLAGLAPKALLMVRDPVSWIASAHAQSINQGGHRDRQAFVSECRATVLNNLNLSNIIQAYTQHGFDVVVLPMELLAEDPDAFWALLEQTCGLATPADLSPPSRLGQNRTRHDMLALAAAINRLQQRLADGVRRGAASDAQVLLQALSQVQSWGSRRGLAGADEATLSDVRSLMKCADADDFLDYSVDAAFVEDLQQKFIAPLRAFETVRPMIERYEHSLEGLLTSPDQKTHTPRPHR